MKRTVQLGAVRFVLAGMTSLVAFGAARVAPDMPVSTTSGPVDIIVQFKSQPKAETLHQVLTAGQLRRQYRAIPAVHMTVPFSMLARIASNPQVVYISPNRTTTGSLDITTQTVNANQFWPSGFDGTGIGVAVIDSGVAGKLDLWTADRSKSRVVFSESFVAGLDASDEYGHGTHVAGIVAANVMQRTPLDEMRVRLTEMSETDLRIQHENIRYSLSAYFAGSTNSRPRRDTREAVPSDRKSVV